MQHHICLQRKVQLLTHRQDLPRQPQSLLRRMVHWFVAALCQRRTQQNVLYQKSGAPVSFGAQTWIFLSRSVQLASARHLHVRQVGGLEDCLQGSAVLGRQRGAAPDAGWQRSDARPDTIISVRFPWRW
jgi:hypothetical protein